MHETNRTRSLLLTACAAAVTHEAGEDAAKVDIHSSVAGYEWLRGNVQSAAHVDQNGAVGVRWVVCDCNVVVRELHSPSGCVCATIVRS
jgi:hypothetical protein